MQAVIMAGGKGTRLATITKDVPKPMVPIMGKPLLEYQIENLKENGVNNIILVIGHLGNVIKDYFGDGKKFGVNISYYYEEEPLGTAGALDKIKDVLEDTFFIVFGDLFINVDFDRFLDFHNNKKSLLTLFSHPNSHPYDSDIVIVNNDNKVIGWSYKKEERKEDYRNLVNAGLYVINKNIIITKVEEIKRQLNIEKIDLEKDIIIPLISEGLIYVYQSSEYVKDVGTPDRLAKVTNDYLRGICESRNLDHKQKCIFLDRDGTINDYLGYITNKDDIIIKDDVCEAIKLINESEYLSVVITNQPIISKGLCTKKDLDKINNRIHTLLGYKHAYLNGLYYCPHDDNDNCECRKPKIGLLNKAAKEFNIDLNSSWFIGDTYKDIQTGKNANMKTILLKTGNPNKGKLEIKADKEADSLLDAIKEILGKDEN